MKTKNELIKRVTIGGYIKADTTGKNVDWEVGRITRSNDKYVWFASAKGGEEVKIKREHAFKATAAEYEDAAQAVLDLIENTVEDTAEVKKVLSEDKTNVPEKSIVKRDYRARYVKTYSAEGNVSRNNGDIVAIMLEGKSVDESYEILHTETGKSMSWPHLNNGQQKMLIGNAIRKHFRDLGRGM